MFTLPTGALLRELRVTAGLGLRRMASKTAFTPGYLSMVETGSKPVTEAVVEAYRRVLGDPALGLSGVDTERLAATVADPSGAGASSLEDIAVILARTRRLEDIAGAACVLPMGRGLDRVARALTNENISGSALLAAEVVRHRGWLESASGNRIVADRALADSAELAERAGDASQLAHALSFRAYVARHDGNLPMATALTDAAIAVKGAHPVPAVYDQYQRAELLALQRDNSAAVRALRRADRAADAVSELEPPSYGYWYTRPFFAVRHGIVLGLLGRHSDAMTEAAAGVAAMPKDHQHAHWLQSALDEIEPGWRP